ncbi:glutamate racemase [Acetohalobium arabaticum]|uniref:Glutamate racemase n=1 Tax=Acetohalobium arabaticum (strain ATCC 49924 / DSM 5501 / Z-7288) TaxID=574087 RepID=D9QPS9_ACEAZ|nr:glutamate racemase [Acetohalobium arabaticum]ADL12520.1 glutamate racemase [Acetohalobium arabaticum DSM 5501]
MKIGFFDSGVGGITVLKEALKVLPNKDYIYYADTANVPYGTKPKEEVKHYVFDAVDFITDQGINALVIACNTATSVAVNDLRDEFQFPIIGMEPAVKPAVEKNKTKKVLVTATPLTLQEEKLWELVAKIGSKDIIDSLPLPKLVEFAENFIFDEETILSYLEERFSSYDLNRYSSIVLGCTHFIFYRRLFRKIIPDDVEIIDGNRGAVKQLKRQLKAPEHKSGTGEIIFYSSKKGNEDNIALREYIRLLD